MVGMCHILLCAGSGNVLLDVEMELRKYKWTWQLLASAAVFVEPGMCCMTGEHCECSEIQLISRFEGSFIVVRI